MLSERDVSAAVGSPAYGTDGDRIGTVEHFYVDDRTGAPSWVAVTTGLFGTKQSIAPAIDARYADGGLRLPVSVDAVKKAPHVTGNHLTPDDETALRRHYGIGEPGPGAVPAPVEREAAEDVDRPGPSSGTGQDRPPDAGTDGAMTRSEEQLVVDTERVATTRARLVKYVVTEDVQITVPIRREEIRVEQVPLDAVDDDRGESLQPADGSVDSGRTPTGGTTAGALPDEIVLHTERPVVTVEVVPVERVRLRTELVHGQETVTEQVEREQVVVDRDAAAGRVGGDTAPRSV